jgi:hypothetical protein
VDENPVSGGVLMFPYPFAGLTKPVNRYQVVLDILADPALAARNLQTFEYTRGTDTWTLSFEFELSGPEETTLNALVPISAAVPKPTAFVKASDVHLTDINGAAEKSTQDLINLVESSGWYEGGEVTPNGGDPSKADVAEGSGIFKTADTKGAPTGFAKWGAKSAITLVDNELNFIYVLYSGGIAEVFATIDPAVLFQEDKTTINAIFREGSVLHIVNFKEGTTSFKTKMTKKDLSISQGKGFGFAERAQGAVIGSTGVRYVTLTAGLFWAGPNEKATLGFDTSGSSTFSTIRRDGTGGHIEVTGQTQINNANFDDNNPTIGTLAPNNYGVYWLYMDYAGDHIYIVYGTGSYNQAEAEASTPPTDVPNKISKFSSLVGRYIIQEGTDDVVSQSAYGFPFQGTGIVDHNGLSGLTGGTALERNHITNQQEAAILPPSMDTTMMVAIATPYLNQRVFNTDYKREFWWSGTQWESDFTQEYNNDSGGALIPGDVIIASSITADSVTVTSDLNSVDSPGVIVLGGGDGTQVTKAKAGARVDVNVDGIVAIGDFIFTGATFALGVPFSTSGSGAFAIALATKGPAPGPVKCEILNEVY